MNASLSFVDMIREQLSSDDLRLPVFSTAALKLQNMLSDDEVDLDEVEKELQLDHAVASQLLRAANSAFYGGMKQIGTIRESVMRLGTKEVLNLAMLITQKQQYASKDKLLGSYIGTLWKHASSCAMGSQWLAKRLGHYDLAQQAFMAGLLHDIGHLFLFKVIENVQAEKPDFTLSETAIEEVMDSMHATQGALLLQRWNLPQVYCDAALHHDSPNYDCSNVIVMIVRLVDRACYRLGIGLHHDPALDLVTCPEVGTLHVTELQLAELEIALEDSVEAS